METMIVGEFGMDPFDICRVCMDEVDSFWPLFEHCELLPPGTPGTPATLISKISGVSVQKDEGLPEMVCNSCLVAMVNAYIIQQKCIASDRKLRKILFYRPVLKPPSVEPKGLFVAVAVPDTDTDALIEHHHELHSDANKELAEKQKLLAKAGSIIEENVPSLPDENEADAAGELNVITVKKEILADFSNVEVQYTEEYLVEEHREHNEVEDHEAASYDEPERLGSDGTIQMEVEIVKTDSRAAQHPGAGAELGKQKHVCDVCGKEFSTKGNLKSHMLLHTNERPFVCEQCGMNFAKKSNYKVHVARHGTERKFPCPECNMSFVHPINLNHHMRKHTGERPFHCQYCVKTFVHYSDKKRHEFKHTGDYPYECGICCRKFVRKQNFMQHVPRCTKRANDDAMSTRTLRSRKKR